MKEIFNDGILTIALEGKIDSANAGEIEKEIDAIRAKYPGAKPMLDMEDLKYISSAGIRVILKLRKLCGELKIVNASSEVYEIFEMTGMTEIMDITKAFRTLSIEGCEVIGQGANGKVYRIDTDTIVKVYRDPNSLPDIQRERELARKAFVLGIPTAIPYDVVKVDGSYGSVFELLNAKSFSKLIAADPEQMDKYILPYVEIMKKLHSTQVKPSDMPEMKSVAVNWAEFLRDYLPSDEAEKLCSLVKAIPERDTMLHGDYHTNNIMMQGDEALLIDMDTLCYGHPIFELASMYMGFVAFGELDPSITFNFLKMPYDLAGVVWNKALMAYIGDEKKAKEVEKKAMVIAYTRLMRRTIRRNGLNTGDGMKTINCCHAHLTELLAEVDTLDY